MFTRSDLMREETVWRRVSAALRMREELDFRCSMSVGSLLHAQGGTAQTSVASGAQPTCALTRGQGRRSARHQVHSLGVQWLHR